MEAAAKVLVVIAATRYVSGARFCARYIRSLSVRKRRLAFTGAGSWAGLLTENLIGGAVNRELRAVSQTGDGHAEAALNQLVSW